MDLQSIARLLTCSKTPLPGVTEILVDCYKEDLRTFASTTMLHKDFDAKDPTYRCKKKVGRGRCTKAAHTLCVAQLCTKHRRTEVNDSNVIGIRLFQEMELPGFPALFMGRND